MLRGFQAFQPFQPRMAGVSLALLVVGFAPMNAYAAAISTVLERVQATGPETLVLTFDQAVDLSRVKTEFFRDIIQVNLRDVTVYPAKFLTTDSGTTVKKVFAYQYTPQLVRARLTVGGSAESFKNRVTIKRDDRKLIITLAAPKTGSKAGKTAGSDQISLSVAQATEVSPPAPIVTPKQEAKKSADAGAAGFPSTKMKLSTQKYSPIRVFGTLMGIVCVLLVAALGLLALKRRGRALGVFRFLNKWTNGKFGSLTGMGTAKEKIIDVVSMHHLGPKRSIAVIRAKDRLLLIGITDESINLITDLGEGFDQEVEAMIQSGATKAAADEILAPASKAADRVRDQIRTKLGGLRPL